MTLFKKVFQNQSQPASSEDLLDEAALRQAFMDVDDAAGPLKLDPFAKVQQPEEDTQDQDDCTTAEEPEAEAFVGQAEEDAFGEEFAGESADDFSRNASMEDVLGSEVTDVHSGRVEDIEAPAEDGTAPDVEQTDAEIAACLDRAIAAGTPSEEERVSHEQVDASGPEEPKVEEEKSLGTPACEVDPEAEGEPEKSTEEEMESVETATELEVDLAQFAQQQLSAFAGEATDSVEPSNQDPKAFGQQDAMPDLEAVPAPAPGRAGRRAGRVKTRLIGFNRTGDAEHDPFGQAPEATAAALQDKYPVGWLVIVEGPGVGHSFSLFTGASMIGRGEDQVIRLDFGDNSISRNNHAAIAYDEEQNKFYIGHGGKSNIIRRNARPVLSTEELHHADLIRIGETTLRFVALCGSDFQWHNAGGIHDDSV